VVVVVANFGFEFVVIVVESTRFIIY
jgi:hypothetical protein